MFSYYFSFLFIGTVWIYFILNIEELRESEVPFFKGDKIWDTLLHIQENISIQ